MRKPLKEHLTRTVTLQLGSAGLESDLIKSEDLPIDVCFRVGTRGEYSFYLHIVCSDENDSFRGYFVWNKGNSYPTSPSTADMNLSGGDAVKQVLKEKAGELQLRDVAQSASVPWVWHLDSTFGKWKNELDKLTADAANGRLNEESYSRHLMDIPKKAPIGIAKKQAELAAAQIVEVLKSDAVVGLMGQLSSGQ